MPKIKPITEAEILELIAASDAHMHAARDMSSRLQHFVSGPRYISPARMTASLLNISTAFAELGRMVSLNQSMEELRIETKAEILASLGEPDA